MSVVRVGRALYGGGCASDAGEVLFALPGELVETGSLLPEVVERSPDRVEPRCVHFGRCGGCQYQHASYAAQLALKRGILQELLAPVWDGDPGVEAAEPWGYRNRIRLRVRRGPDGFAVGYSARGTNDFLPIQMCPIAAPLLLRAAFEALRLSERDVRWAELLGGAAELELFTNAEEQRLQIQLWLRELPAKLLTESSLGRLAEALRDPIPELDGVGVCLHPDAPRRLRQRWAGVGWGAAGLLYSIADAHWWVSRGAFFQVNRFLLPAMLEHVVSSEGGDLAWDLYAGVGLFSRELAGRFRRVVGVEGGPVAAADLLALGRRLPALEARQESTLEFLERAVTGRDRPELVVADPPRAGLGAEAAGLLARMGAARIVYVSCDPTTLARDLRVLVASGYRVTSVTLFDLFPQTYHLETVVRLERQDSAVV